VDQNEVGLSVADYWRVAAYLFGFIAAVCWVAFALLLGDPERPVSPAPWLWMAGAVSLTVFSAASAVINAVKSLEARLRAKA
jgi:hypothetical protein